MSPTATATIPQILKECRTAMDKALEAARRELGSIRSGKAAPALLDTVRADAYGQSMAINQLASVTAPEARLLVVTPWDKGLIKAIEKAIRESDLGLDPAIQGAIIRVPLPSLNQERRRDLVKVVHKLAEEGRVAIRHARTEGRDRMKKMDKVSEDEVKHGEKELQKLHDEFIHRVEEALRAKEAEILEV